ncbi:unnamed protein product [Phytophthora fragariaefolia]|uniref:Unnamed protein product n=1 Tax=Phytophthora fragariaefolia TaxID=1490495 RepID=A0A9W6YDQ9_9STRA|nr:unnamed protein product [Phytophthora fragariaefolia]
MEPSCVAESSILSAINPFETDGKSPVYFCVDLLANHTFPQHNDAGAHVGEVVSAAAEPSSLPSRADMQHLNVNP